MLNVTSMDTRKYMIYIFSYTNTQESIMLFNILKILLFVFLHEKLEVIYCFVVLIL